LVSRVMIFYDLENFKQGLLRRDGKRKYDYGRVQYLILDMLRKIIKGRDDNEYILVRAYAYTGEYTDSMLKIIKDDFEKAGDEKLRKLLEKTQRRMKSQRKMLDNISKFNFFEVRTYPLKYSKGQIFQKGIDVQLAVDLVTHAFRDNFDVAVVCSGDIDLLESLKIVKSLGKTVVLMSHPMITAKALRKEADFYIDMSKLRDEDLDKMAFKEKGGEI
jgi:uncharacterized LabA/DUF88 family protein